MEKKPCKSIYLTDNQSNSYIYQMSTLQQKNKGFFFFKKMPDEALLISDETVSQL